MIYFLPPGLGRLNMYKLLEHIFDRCEAMRFYDAKSVVSKFAISV